ncbi:hypothetical protein [Chryseobacterium aureum]|uniref:hypothetical protein n=1 Tax=Chryseobacterium aureum TaxID=2497456 RepID=UPI000F88DB40|nr:hypothetical protein [Chryseobacterium aureum]
MIEIKLLKVNIEPIGVDNLDSFIQGLNNVLDREIDIVTEIDSSFNGYYLLPMGFMTPESRDGFVKQNINEKVFLLSVINSNIPGILEECKPAGITNWMLFRNASTAIIGKTKVIDKIRTQNEDDDEMYEDYGYDEYVPIPFDGTYETVAKAI